MQTALRRLRCGMFREEGGLARTGFYNSRTPPSAATGGSATDGMPQRRASMGGLALPVVEDSVAAVRAALAAGCGDVRFDRLSRGLYSTDASVYQIVPLGVVLPRREEEIVHAVRTCTRLGVPLTARGGGTSQAGQCIGPGVILDCSKHFHDVLEINAAERWARVRPGCVLDDLNAAAKPHGLHFAPDISTSNRATIGGMVANNSSGTHS